MAKFLLISPEDGPNEEYSFQCPGCKSSHWVRVSGSRPFWSWNGDLDKPTVSPSLIVRGYPVSVCHFFIIKGKIEFLSDSTHGLSGMTVEIPEWEPLI